MRFPQFERSQKEIRSTAVLRQAGGGGGVHDLRHTAATNMHQLTGDFYTVGQILGHSLKGIGIQLQLSNNLEAVTAQYVDVRMERKLYVLNIYHEAVLGSSEKT